MKITRTPYQPPATQPVARRPGGVAGMVANSLVKRKPQGGALNSLLRRAVAPVARMKPRTGGLY